MELFVCIETQNNQSVCISLPNGLASIGSCIFLLIKKYESFYFSNVGYPASKVICIINITYHCRDISNTSENGAK